MAEALIDQLLRVLPVSSVLRHGLQGRQDLCVEDPETLRGTAQGEYTAQLPQLQ